MTIYYNLLQFITIYYNLLQLIIDLLTTNIFLLINYIKQMKLFRWKRLRFWRRAKNVNIRIDRIDNKINKINNRIQKLIEKNAVKVQKQTDIIKKSNENINKLNNDLENINRLRIKMESTREATNNI